MPLPPLTESIVKNHANANSWSRGEAYYNSGAVSDLVQRGTQIQASVEDSDLNPYRITLQFDAGGIPSAYCTCPYEFEGWCKHIVATALTCIRKPKAIVDRPTLPQLLDRLDPLQTQRLVQALVKEQPDLIDAIDRQVTLLTATTTPAKKPTQTPRRPPIDVKPFRQQVKQIIRDGLRDLEDGYEDDPTTSSLLEVIVQAQTLTEKDRPDSAIAILEAIADTLIQDWDDLADYGLDSEEVTDALNTALTEAILSGELDEEQKIDMLVRIAEWQDTLGSLDMSEAAVQQGWDYPPLQQVLQGNITDQGAWDGESPDFADDLALIRLRVLDRQGRDEEYLYLAEAEGQTVPYFTKLIEMGEIEAVMEIAGEMITTPEEAFAIAQALHEQGEMTEALAIAQAGLLLPTDNESRRFPLATWTSDLAEALGETQTALEARIVAYKAQPSFQDYRRIQDLAGQNWSKIRPELLQALQHRGQWNLVRVKVDIFLYEGMVEEAIQALNRDSFYNDLIYRVMEAAISVNPQWVIDNGKQLAEPIMDQKKADRYTEAVQWLQQVRLGYLQLGQQTQWSEYREELMQLHARKPKLMGLFQQLGR
ncbi:MAG: SWIM zinc finger family protein [Oculatellaceae cyanobacterium Prado106]|jgi:uncharacterized Zn finger protein|nr:SWIM zinc finger family protein [Oculatellaceae cyanobacterium Prado106]